MSDRAAGGFDSRRRRRAATTSDVFNAIAEQQRREIHKTRAIYRARRDRLVDELTSAGWTDSGA